MKLKTKCIICNQEVLNDQLPKHLLKFHDISSKEYYDKFLKKENEGVCIICNNETKFITPRLGYRKTCSHTCANLTKAHKQTDEIKLQRKTSYLIHNGVDISNLSIEDIDNKHKEILSFFSKKQSIKRLETNNLRYGKGSVFGSEESIFKQRISILVNKGLFRDDLEKKSKKDIDILYSNLITNRMNSKDHKIKRISKQLNIPIELLITYDDEIIQKLYGDCYRKSLIEKGKKIVEKYNLGDINSFSEEDLSKLSGYEKKKNARNRTEEEKYSDKRKWIITHLSNFYKKDKESYVSFSNSEIDNQYRIYLYESGRLRNIAIKGRGGKWLKGFVKLERLNLEIFYRSSYEKDFLLLCDRNINISSIEFNLEGIKYKFENEDHYYFPDFIIHYLKDKFLIEIKSEWQLKEAKTVAKLESAKIYCINTNLTFLILTEKELYQGEENLWKEFHKKY